MADDFEKAILFTFDQTGAVDNALKERAQAYCDEFKRSPDNWSSCIQHFTKTQYPEVKFWCLQALLETMRCFYSTMAVANRTQVKQALLGWISDDLELAPFLKNKLAQIVVHIVQVEYPEQWPTFFQDLLILLPKGTHAIDMFCRILLAIDDDIISLDIPRSQEESRRSMRVKDAMRELCIVELAEAWYQLTSGYKDSHPDLAAMVLEAVQKYINWIDIGLIANEKFIPLLFTLPNSPSEALQAAACGCIIEVLAKRMDALYKLQLIQQLRIVQVCKMWMGGMPPQTAEAGASDELAEKYAALLATLATELLECWKRAENGVMSIAAVGLAVDPEAMQEARESTNTALSLLSEIFPAVISALHSPVDGVSTCMIPFLLSYMQRLKRMPQVSQQHMQHARLTLKGLLHCAMYPADTPEVLPSVGNGEILAMAEEIEESVQGKRKEVFTLFKSIAKISLSDTTSFVAAHLEAVIANAQANFQEVEIIVTLLYQLGEGATEEFSKPGCGILGQMAAGLMQAQLPHARHRLVAVAVLEAFVRYCRVIQAQPNLAQAVLGALLDDRGMGHSSETVSTRACYLFQRLVRQLRSSFTHVVETILAGLEPHLVHIASTPVAQTSSAAHGGPALLGPKGTQGKGPMGAVSYLDDRMYAFEAAGLLLGGDDLPTDRQLAFVQGLLAPLVQQIKSNTGAAANGCLTEAHMIQHALAAISHMSKGFTHQVATVSRPGIGDILLRVLEAALQVPVAAPRNKLLRARVLAFLHRLVEVLGANLVPYIPRTLEALLFEGMDAQDTADVLGLFVQLICRLKGNMQAVCDVALGPIMEVTQQLLPPDWDWSGRTGTGMTGAPHPGQAESQQQAPGNAEEMREKAELQRSYIILIHALCNNSMTVALSRLNISTLQPCMQALVATASTHVDPGVRKTCLQTLGMLVSQWLTPASATNAAWEAFPGFRRWTVDHVIGDVCMRGILQGGLDLQDAAISSLIGEVASILIVVYGKCGEEIFSVCNCAGWPQAILEQLTAAVRTVKDWKELKRSLSEVVRQMQNAQKGIT